MAPASQTVGTESGNGLSLHQRKMISEMIERLGQGLLDGAPLFAQRRMLSDLSVYASLVFRARSLCTIRDAEFLHNLSALEQALARNQGLLEPRHLDDIRRWFDIHGALSP